MVDEIDFKCSCPVLECVKAKRTNIIYWVDGNLVNGTECHGHYKLTKYGKLICQKCWSSGDLLASRFKCQYHERASGTFQALVSAITIAAQLELGEDDSPEFLETIMFSLFEQKKKNINFLNNYILLNN